MILGGDFGVIARTRAPLILNHPKNYAIPG